MGTIDERLRAIIACHFDPDGGSPYWLRRRTSLGFEPRERIMTVDDLSLFGPMEMAPLQRLPVSEFIPRCHAQRPLVLAETGGATGDPKGCAYFHNEFEEAFVTSFLVVTQLAGISWPLPEGRHWLYLGPGGPHIIGKAASRIARLTSLGDGFSVDFDPRWFRRLATGSVAQGRYLDHLLEQALRLVEKESIGALFATRAVLLPLAQRLREATRQRIVFIYLGGMATNREQRMALRAFFPNARFCDGYGNTLVGVCHQSVDGDLADAPGFYPHGHRLHLRLVSLEEGADLFAPPCFGQSGRVVISRLDESFFLPNLFERDQGDPVPSGPQGQTGVGYPRPLIHEKFKVEQGIY